MSKLGSRRQAALKALRAGWADFAVRYNQGPRWAYHEDVWADAVQRDFRRQAELAKVGPEDQAANDYADRVDAMMARLPHAPRRGPTTDLDAWSRADRHDWNEGPR
jgi:hypothetical protein